MAMSAEDGLKFAALNPQWWRLHMSEKKNPSGTKKLKKQKQNQTI